MNSVSTNVQYPHRHRALMGIYLFLFFYIHCLYAMNNLYYE